MHDRLVSRRIDDALHQCFLVLCFDWVTGLFGSIGSFIFSVSDRCSWWRVVRRNS